MIKIKEAKVIVKPSDIKPSLDIFEVLGVLNPGAVRLKNGNILLMVRVIEKLKEIEDKDYFFSPRCIGEEKYKIVVDKFKKEEVEVASDLDIVFKDMTKRFTFISHLRRVILDKSGMRIIKIDKKPSFYGLSWDGEYGIEDARIIKMKNGYIMTYVGLSKNGGISTYLAISNDCYKWYRRGIIFKEQNKDVVIFQDKINGKFMAFDRPEGNLDFSRPHIWASYSDNLEYWGKPTFLMLSEEGRWDSGRVGAGPPPIKINDGWLFIYHGVVEKSLKFSSFLGKLKGFFKTKEFKEFYCVGAVLLDLNNPLKIIKKSKNPIIIPKYRYEKENFIDKGVVFPTGAIFDLNGKDLLIYSGGGDTVTTVKKVALKDILESMEEVS